MHDNIRKLVHVCHMRTFVMPAWGLKHSSTHGFSALSGSVEFKDSPVTHLRH